MAIVASEEQVAGQLSVSDRKAGVSAIRSVNDVGQALRPRTGSVRSNDGRPRSSARTGASTAGGTARDGVPDGELRECGTVGVTDDFGVHAPVEPKGSITLLLDAPVPGVEEVKRPTRVVFTAHREQGGFSDNRIRRMLKAEASRRVMVEALETERAIASFEGTAPHERDIPPIPLQGIDQGVLRDFRPPSASRWLDIPRLRRTVGRAAGGRRRPQTAMQRRCELCNPREIKRRAFPCDGGRRQTAPPDNAVREVAKLPFRTGVSCWNIVDQPTAPMRGPSRDLRSPAGRAPFSVTQFVPDMQGIPVLLDAVTESRTRQEIAFQRELARRDEDAAVEQERVLRDRRAESLRLHDRLSSWRAGLSVASGAGGPVSSPLSVVSRRTVRVSRDDAEAMAALDRCDEEMRLQARLQRQNEQAREMDGLRTRSLSSAMVTGRVDGAAEGTPLA